MYIKRKISYFMAIMVTVLFFFTAANKQYILLAAPANASVTVKAADVLKVKEEGYVGDIVIEETVPGSLTKNLEREDRIITLGLENSELEFASDNVTIQTSKGFSGVKNIFVGYKEDAKGNKDKGALEVVLPKLSGQKENGKLVISNIKVKGVSPKEGPINITVSSSVIGKVTVKAGEIESYGITLSMKNEYSVPVVAGSKQKLTFSLTEDVPVSMIPGRYIDIRLEKGYLSPYEGATDKDISIGKILLNGVDVKNQVNFRILKEDDFIVGFRFYIPELNSKKANTITFEDVVIYVPVNATKDIILTAEGRDIAGTLSIVAAKLKQATQITVSPVDLKLDTENQKGGKIIIAETGRSMLMPGSIKVELEDTRGIWFEDKPTVTVTKGDLKIGKIYYSSKDPRTIEIEVKSSSKEASVIEISNFLISVDNTVADGSYKVMVYGSAFGIEGDFERSEGQDFIFIGRLTDDIPVKPTPEPKPQPAPQPVKTTAKFTIGERIYSVNDVQKLMDAKPFVADGRTMVPIKYVSEIAGVDPKNITYNNGVVTVIAKNKVIILEKGSNVAKVNGISTLIDGQVIIYDGRTYVPVSQIAKLLDIKVTWDASTKTAIFETN